MSGCVSAPLQSAKPTASEPTNASSASKAPSSSDRPLVVATNTVVCDLTRQIAADTVTLKCLIDAGADPHEYKPKPEDSKAIEQAKLILYGGYNFEPEAIRLIQASANTAPKVAVNELAVSKPQQFEEHGKTETDPHVFHTAANGALIATVISKSLIQLQPSQVTLYAANTKKVTDELTQIHTWIKAEIATIPVSQRKLMTTHDAFGYYSKAYGIPVVGALQGLSTDEKATPSRVKTLVQEIKAANVPTIFAEATINPKLIEAVANEAGIKVAEQELFADGLGEKGSKGDTYQTFFIANTKAIVEGLGGKYTPFQAK
ncbi:metal ABC transporter substrate-binding protein [Stenomitos frigidus ULC18]|uniref:Metal ABC transporter substrate-binding protein n=1 Tax=Stenomitos frigidus ULC18 TaxID=2107698 RepID=A0A2T1DU97_9CYAN|nr:metal ABC transporter substrate-binding protein [Stenomitos frigidus ULC18]